MSFVLVIIKILKISTTFDYFNFLIRMKTLKKYNHSNWEFSIMGFEPRTFQNSSHLIPLNSLGY
jgi:hypothetical protein